MKNKLRHVFLFIGFVSMITGLVLFVFGTENQKNYLISVLSFMVGAYLIMKALNNTHQKQRKPIEIKKKLLEAYSEKKDLD